MYINNNKYSQYIVYNMIFGISVPDYTSLVVYSPILPPEGYLFTKLYVQVLLPIYIIHTNRTNKHTHNNQVLII